MPRQAGDKNEPISHLRGLKPGILEPSDGEEGCTVTPEVPAMSTLTRWEEAGSLISPLTKSTLMSRER